MMKNNSFICLIALIVASCNVGSTSKESKASSDSTAENSAATDQIQANPLKDCYFGDLHLHTSLSMDANFYGATSLPEDSYKYAIGEEVTYIGQKIKRLVPLDFLAVTDHAEYLGIVTTMRDPNGPFAGTEIQKLYTSKDPKDIGEAYSDAAKDIITNKPRAELNNQQVIKSNGSISRISIIILVFLCHLIW